MYNCGICHAKGISAKPALKYVELRADGSIAREDKICAGCHRGFVIKGHRPAKTDKHTIVVQQGVAPANHAVVPATAVSTLLSEASSVTSAPMPGLTKLETSAPPSPAEVVEPIVLPKLTAPDDYVPKPLTVTVTLPKPEKSIPVAKSIKVTKPKPVETKIGKPKIAVTETKTVKPRAKLKVIDKSKTRKS